MAHDLTEVNEFSNDGTLEVPDGTDDHHNLSAFIASIAQTLANRSQNLRAITAKLGAPNTFTAENDFNGQSDFHGTTNFDDMLYVNPANAERPLLMTDSRPSDSAIAGNRWRTLFTFRTGTTGAGGQYVRVFSGRDGTAAGNGCFAITTNVDWDADTQLWIVRDTAVVASALIWRYGGVRFAEVAPGTPNFADWPSVHTTAVDITTGANAGLGQLAINGGNGNVLGNALPALIWLPFRLPHGTTVSRVEIMHHLGSDGSGGAELFELFEKAPNWADPGVSELILKGSALSDVDADVKITPMPVTPFTIDGSKEYMMRWAPQHNLSEIQGVRVVGWTDPGLRNY
jgi:hypothetical protein